MELNRKHRDKKSGLATHVNVNMSGSTVQTGPCQIDMIYTEPDGSKRTVSFHPHSVDVQYGSDFGWNNVGVTNNKYVITVYL